MMIVFEAKQFNSGKVFSGAPKETVSEALQSFYLCNPLRIDFNQNILVEKFSFDGDLYSRSEEDWFWYFDPKEVL